MSRTRHLTRYEAGANARPTRRRAKTRLTKLGDRTYWPNPDRPKNAGNDWGASNNAGQRRRKDQREQKVLGRRLERRRLNRSLVP
ncbi:MAG TPA: hypothetical protein VLE97_07295 [Gaiellaceae bacterium]|nr:hypothetical protein [Gaiellaceae bacterium]